MADASPLSNDTLPIAPLGDDLRLPKLSHMVAKRLREQIISGRLAAGTSLPPEAELLKLFNVSRPTLREALRILEAEALISVGRGVRSGASILGPSITKAAEYANFVLISEGVTMRDLHEARMFFEPAIVLGLEGQALKSATLELRDCVRSIEAALSEDRFADVVAGTNRFHEALAAASGNKTLSILLRVLQSISDDAYAVILASENASPEAAKRNMTKTVAGYAALCDLLEKGKNQEAASFWRRYMERALEFLNKSKIGDRRLLLNNVPNER